MNRKLRLSSKGLISLLLLLVLTSFYYFKDELFTSSSFTLQQLRTSSFNSYSSLSPSSLSSFSSHISFDIYPRANPTCPQSPLFIPPSYITALAVPEGRVRIGFNILFHKNVEQIFRLISALKPTFSSSSIPSDFAHYFVINVDPRVNDTDFKLLEDKISGMEGIFHITRWKMCYAGIESLLADLKNTQYLLSLKPTVDFVINLSGTDYLVRPIEELHEFLSYHKGISFVHTHTAVSPNRWRYKRVKNCGVTTDLTEPKEEPNFVICQGYHWHIMARDLALFATQSSFSRDVLNFLSEVFIPEEFFFATMAANCPCEYRTFPMRYYTWDDWCRPPNLSPCTMQESMFHYINRTGFFFARKFDFRNQTSLKLMDMFDEEIERRTKQRTTLLH